MLNICRIFLLGLFFGSTLLLFAGVMRGCGVDDRLVKKSLSVQETQK